MNGIPIVGTNVVGVNFPPFPGYYEGGEPVDQASDKERLDWLITGNNRQRLRVLKSGILLEGVNAWQASERAAIDVGIDIDRKRRQMRNL